jgi:hypothetical protein
VSRQFATTTLTRAVTVAEGVYAPGHLGELTQQIPFELVDDVLDQTLTTQTRLRMLPSRVGVYFVLALALFPTPGYLRVWDKITAGLRGLDLARPSEKALRDLRRDASARHRWRCCSTPWPDRWPGRTPPECATGAGAP